MKPAQFFTISVTALLAGFSACGGGGSAGAGSAKPTGGGGQPPASGEEVTIARDVFGVPHVTATSEAGAMFGSGYAAAQDRLFQMFRSRLMMHGRTAEFFGPGETIDPVTGNVTHLNKAHDRATRTIGWRRYADAAVLAMDADTLQLLQAYCDGVNAYIASPGASFHPFFEQFGVPLDEWIPADCVAVWARFARHFSDDGLHEDYLLHQWQALLANPNLTYEQALAAMLGARACDDEAAVVQQSDVPPALQQAMRDYARQLGLDPSTNCRGSSASPKFSQAWAVAGTRTTTGNSVLVGDPRVPVTVPSIFYEWSMQSQSFSVRGVGVAGAPHVLVGATDRVAWSPTAIGTDQADMLLLTTDPAGHPGEYLLDGNWVPYAVDELEELLVDGVVVEHVRYRETYWGPVVTAISAQPLAGEEYALHRVPLIDPGADPAPVFPALYRSGNVEELNAVLAHWTWPAVNLVFADVNGRIGYSSVGTIPIRNPNLDLAGMVAQDGSLSDNDWIDILPNALRPRVLDPAAGFLFSANHMPIGSWYPIPVRWGSGSAGDTPRSRRLRELFANSPASMTPQQVFAFHHDVVDVPRRDLVELGLFLRDGQPSWALSADARSALGEAETWWQQGARMDGSHRASALMAQVDLSFRSDPLTDPLIALYGAGENGLMLFLGSRVSAVRAQPPAALSSHEAAFVDDLFGRAWLACLAIGPPDTWQAWYVSNQLTFAMDPWTNLEGLPSLQPGAMTFGPVRCVDSQTLLSLKGQSYTQRVQLDGGDGATSLAPPGQHEQPSHPHGFDQVLPWETEGFKLAPRTLAGAKTMGPVQTTALVYDPIGYGNE
jgi:penicillin amidase